jgi:hypothetical protein
LISENQVSGRQPRRAVFWDAQHADRHVSNHKRPRNVGSRPETPVFKTQLKSCLVTVDIDFKRLRGFGPSGKRALVDRSGGMGKESIIFFDKLGFGWVVDSAVLKDVKLGILGAEDSPERSLVQIIETLLAEKPAA